MRLISFLLMFVLTNAAAAAPATILIEKRAVSRVGSDLKGLLLSAKKLPPQFEIVLFDATDLMAARGRLVDVEAAQAEFFDSIAAARIRAALDDALPLNVVITDSRCTTIEDTLARAARHRGPVLLISECPGLCRKPTKPIGTGKNVFVVLRSEAGGNRRKLVAQREAMIRSFLPEANVFEEFELTDAVTQFLESAHP